MAKPVAAKKCLSLDNCSSIGVEVAAVLVEGPVTQMGLGWFQLWPLADIYSLNDGYNVAEYAPELLGFGSDCGKAPRHTRY